MGGDATRALLRWLRRWARVAVALLLGTGAARAQEAAVPGSAADEVFVSPARAWEIAGDGAGVILDVRGRVSFVMAHPKGAVQTDWQAFSDPDEEGRLYPDLDELARRIGVLGISNDRPVVVIGKWDEGWGEEGRLFWMLEYLGHPDVHIVEGGFDAWLDAGLPLEVGAPSVEPATFVPHVVPERLARLDDVVRGGAELIDTRTADEYGGATPFGAVRGGHVPGARNITWDQLITHTGLKDRATLEGLLGPDTGRTIAYCTGGVRSGFVYAVLRSLGRTDAANYAGSWWEYARSDYPVDRAH